MSVAFWKFYISVRFAGTIGFVCRILHTGWVPGYAKSKTATRVFGSAASSDMVDVLAPGKP